jgi:hypothetical protein
MCHPLNSEGFDILGTMIDGTPRQVTWTPVEVRIVRENQGRKLSTSDSPWCIANTLVLRHRAIEALGPMFTAHGELLPLVCKDADVAAYNATHFLDALDEAKSTVARFDDGRLMHVWTFALRREVVADAVIFRLPNLTPSPILVGQQFVERWNAAGLRGLNFTKIWSTE